MFKKENLLIVSERGSPMKIKFVFEATPFDYYREGRRVLREETLAIFRIHETELEFLFYDHMQVCHRVYIVSKNDTKIAHLESDTEEFKKDGVDKYVAAALYVLQQDIKKDGFDVVDGDYLKFIEEHYKLKRGDEGTSPSGYSHYSKSYRYVAWNIALVAYLILGIALTIIFAFAFKDEPATWIINLLSFLVFGVVIFIVNNLLEHTPKDFFLKGKREEEKE